MDDAKLLERLKELSTWTRRRFVTNYEKSWRIHQIDWAMVSQDSFCTGLRASPVEEHDFAAWQFALSSNEHGRVHGFLIADTFYLVWLDPDHRLYAAK